MIESIVRGAGRSLRGRSQIGDDVAVVVSGRGNAILKTDMLVEHTDMPPGMTYSQAARKAVAMCVSDFAAKGVRPDSFMISLGLRRGTSQGEIDGLARGFREAERRWGVSLVGGDTNEAKELIVDCAMVGFAERIVTRGGARPGDLLVVTGAFGLAPAGLKILMAGAKAEPGFARAAKRSVLEPEPSLRIGLSLAPHLTSALDSSDGLARSIHTLARASRVGFEVQELPAADGLEGFARSNGLDPVRLVLEGGEEYVIVGTVRESGLGPAEEAVRRSGGRLAVIGRATAGRRVELKSGRRRQKIRDAGWTHLG